MAPPFIVQACRERKGEVSGRSPAPLCWTGPTQAAGAVLGWLQRAQRRSPQHSSWFRAAPRRLAIPATKGWVPAAGSPEHFGGSPQGKDALHPLSTSPRASWAPFSLGFKHTAPARSSSWASASPQPESSSSWDPALISGCHGPDGSWVMGSCPARQARSQSSGARTCQHGGDVPQAGRAAPSPLACASSHAAGAERR